MDTAHVRREAILKIVGAVLLEFVSLLGAPLPEDRNIYLGESNLEHMKTSHPSDFEKYGTELINILAYPDYVGYRKDDGTFEYIKEFIEDGNHVKVAVRMSCKDRLYARTLYILNEYKVHSYLKKGTIIPISCPK